MPPFILNLNNKRKLYILVTIVYYKMMPLILKLKKTRYKEIAKAQDIIIEELYREFENAVLHGGTSVWRCYQGNRFSEDIDVYIAKSMLKIENLFNNLQKRGFAVNKKKISNNSIYSDLTFNRINVRLEAIFKKSVAYLKEYETSEGNLITVYTLTPEQLIKEKISAYLNRLKIRDLYDIFFLLRYVKNKDEVVKELNKLIKNFKEPIDKDELKVLIIEGLVPDTKKMIDYIRRWMK